MSAHEHKDGAGTPNIPVPVDVELGPIERLREYPFLEKVSETVLKKLQPNLFEKRYDAGDLILRSGAYSDAAYYLREGLVEVHLPAASELRPRTAAKSAKPAVPPANEGLWSHVQHMLGRSPAATSHLDAPSDRTILLSDLPVDMQPSDRAILEPGEIFGEIGALSRYPVSADVVAQSPVVCLMIRTPALRMLFKQKELAAFKTFIDERYRTRSLANHLKRVDIFGALDEKAIAQLQACAELLSFEPGAMLAEQDAPCDAFYMVRGGYVRVAVRAGGSPLAVTYLRKGDHAGETGLLLDEPWPFSLTALEHVELVKINRTDFDRVLASYPSVRESLWAAVAARLKQRGSALENPLGSRYLQMAMDTGLIHGESVLLIDLDTCTRCDDCVRACADTHGGTPRFIREGLKYQHWSVPTACYQCTDPVCMIGCPTGAITRAFDSLEVTINADTCIGCGNCVKRCPWGNIVSVPYASPTLGRTIELATKCDLCVGRSAGPACVQMCPHGSAIRISFKDFESVTNTLSR